MTENESKQRAKLITEYIETITARIDLARERLRELNALATRFKTEDKKLIGALHRFERSGEKLYLYRFQITESLDIEELEQTVLDHIEQLTDDLSAVAELREEAEEADTDGSEYDDDEEEEEEEDE